MIVKEHLNTYLKIMLFQVSLSANSLNLINLVLFFVTDANTR